MKKFKGNKFTRAMGKAGLGVKKHSPLILTVTGGVGLIATAILTYKAAPKIEKIVEDIEAKREVEKEYNDLTKKKATDVSEADIRFMEECEADPESMTVNRMEVAKDVAGALALPVLTGVGSICAITLSYWIMKNRVGSLSAAVATLAAENLAREKFLKEQLTEEQWNDLEEARMAKDKEYNMRDKESGEVVEEKAKGKETREQTTLRGVWFKESGEYASDDSAYNAAFVRNASEVIDAKYARRGWISLNEVLDILGCERTRAGAAMGWTMSDPFTIATDIVNETDQYGDWAPQLWVKWPMPRYIYDEIDLEGRYSMYEV